MNHSERPDFGKLMGVICESFGKTPTEAMLEAYWLTLGDLSLDEVSKAVLACLRECRYFPSPSEVLDRAGGLSGGAVAELAWEAVLGAIRRHGGWATVQFEDPAIPSCIERMGGWERLTGLPSDELLKWGRRDFLAMYRNWRLQAGVSELSEEPAALPGMSKGEPVRIPAPYLDRVKHLEGGSFS